MKLWTAFIAAIRFESVKVLASNVSMRDALVVNRVFFEMACRYDKLLATEPKLLPAILVRIQIIGMILSS